MGEERFPYDMTKDRLNKSKELEQEHDLFKQLLAEKKIESKLKDELLKKKNPQVKKSIRDAVYCLENEKR